MTAEYHLSSFPTLLGTEATAIFAAGSVLADLELARMATAQRIFDETVLFLVWPSVITEFMVRNGRIVYAPWHKFLGARLHTYGYYVDMEPAPTGAIYMTAEQLGFLNSELLAHSRDLDLLRAYTSSFVHGGVAPRQLRYRVHRVTNAIKEQLAAWERRRGALVTWGRAN